MKPTIIEWITALYERMPPEVRPLAIIGGGALRAYFDGTRTKDIDLFFRTQADWLAAQDVFSAEGATWELDCPVNTGIAHYNGAIFNLVGFHTVEDAETAAWGFDFRCVGMAASWGSHGEIEFYAVPGAIDDAEAKRLNFLTMQRTNRVVKRLRRYVDELGYTPSDQFIADLPRCSTVPANTGCTY